MAHTVACGDGRALASTSVNQVRAMAKKRLADYQAKRDFEKTSEPSGKAKIRAAEYPRFVIQKHDATRLHYDLMTCGSSMTVCSSPGR